MFQRFTERARHVVVLAQEEARRLGHNYIGTEHILLGLLREEEGIATRVLESLEVSLDDVRAHVARVVGTGGEVVAGQIPFTPRAKKVLELSLREARKLRHGYIGTEHLLLALARDPESVASRILLDSDVDAYKLRDAVLGLLSGPGVRSPRAAGLVFPSSVPPELVAEIERVRQEKEAAVEAQHFDRAAELRGRERALLQRAYEHEDVPSHVTFEGALEWPSADRQEGVWKEPVLVAAVALAAVGFPLGLFVGWLIWG